MWGEPIKSKKESKKIKGNTKERRREEYRDIGGGKVLHSFKAEEAPIQLFFSFVSSPLSTSRVLLD